MYLIAIYLTQMNETLSTDGLMATLGDQLRAARLRRNISRKDLASEAGVALGSLSNLENGTGATVATLVRVVRSLGLISWLESLQPEVTISPMQMLRAKQPRQRARRAGKAAHDEKL